MRPRLLLFPLPTDGGGVGLIPDAVITPAPDALSADQPERDFDIPDAPGTAPAADLAGGASLETPGSGLTPAPAARTPADPNAVAGAGTAAQPEWRGIRETALGLGVDLGRFASDDQALQHLLMAQQQSQQANYYAQLGQQLAPHVSGIQGYLAQQQQQRPGPAERPAWQPPAFDKRYMQMVERDPGTGLFVGKPGVQAEIVKSVNDYATWFERYQEDPASVIQPMVDARATEIANTQIANIFAQRERAQALSEIQAAASDWLYQKGPQGQIALDYTGRPALTPIGTRYVGIVDELSRAGIKDPRALDNFARRQLQAELATTKTKSQAAAASQAANPGVIASLAGAGGNRGLIAATPPDSVASTPGAGQQSFAGKSLQQTIAELFAAEGITDNDFNPE